MMLLGNFKVFLIIVCEISVALMVLYGAYFQQRILQIFGFNELYSTSNDEKVYLAQNMTSNLPQYDGLGMCNSSGAI